MRGGSEVEVVQDKRPDSAQPWLIRHGSNESCFTGNSAGAPCGLLHATSSAQVGAFYWLVICQSLTARVLTELYSAQEQIGIVAYERLDGRMILPEAAKALQMAE